jgi:hypothetical protein
VSERAIGAGLETRGYPATAGALLVDGQVHTHSSVRGDLRPELHPMIHRALLTLPIARRERYLGWCAEPVLLSDRLFAAAADLPAGATLTPAQARAALRGARITVVRVREPGDASHGTPQPPCRSCAVLLELFGVEVVMAPAGPGIA